MGPNLVFRGGVHFADPSHGPRSRPSASSSNFVFYQPNVSPKCFGFTKVFWFQTGQTDRRTDRQTDRRNKYVLGLPCFKKLSSELKHCKVYQKTMNTFMIQFFFHVHTIDSGATKFPPVVWFHSVVGYHSRF